MEVSAVPWYSPMDFPFTSRTPGATFALSSSSIHGNLPLAPRLSVSGVDGSPAGFVTMPTQQASSLGYVNGRRVLTRTIIRDGLITALCFEDGQLIAHTAERAVHARTPEAPAVPYTGRCRAVDSAERRPISPHNCCSAVACQRSQIRRQKVSIEETAERPTEAEVPK
ncbi:hypothetical protein HPB50_009972 [Hyalomma asiaticum]|uniref:Uncharacterized protein n=1 Tax=Hyalomma asiaticum TaxID=266040 RepID=A0ACB7S1M1_HYAAI|nr:hypothetical protein HPB50_009972 [Hyalomma asiaticum]